MITNFLTSQNDDLVNYFIMISNKLLMIMHFLIILHENATKHLMYFY